MGYDRKREVDVLHSEGCGGCGGCVGCGRCVEDDDIEIAVRNVSISVDVN
jgi:hypothetical protein